MLQITFTEEEKLTLRDLLQCCLSELRVEIHHTDDMDFKDMLKNRKKVLVKILEELSVEGEQSEPTCK
ncbi:MAG: hypothetical protein IH585_18690 [Anaerolineaceae bacterium]|nr:hypothetical protein [Anaerolineaceae bacterium]